MQTKVNFASPEEPLTVAQQKMIVQRSRTLPVENAERELLGLLTVEDINEANRLMSVSPALMAGS